MATIERTDDDRDERYRPRRRPPHLRLRLEPPLEQNAAETAIIERVRDLCAEFRLDVGLVGTILAVIGNGLADALVTPDGSADRLLADLAVAGAWLAE